MNLGIWVWIMVLSSLESCESFEGNSSTAAITGLTLGEVSAAKINPNSGRKSRKKPFSFYSALDCEQKLERVAKRVDSVSHKLDLLLLQLPLASFMLNTAVASKFGKKSSIYVNIEPIIQNIIDNGNVFNGVEMHDINQRRSINFNETAPFNLNATVYKLINTV